MALFALWLLSLRLRDASIVDIFWGTGFVIIAWITFAAAARPTSRAALAALLTTLWGLHALAAAGHAYWTAFSPAWMAFLLLRVSGVTLLRFPVFGALLPQYVAGAGFYEGERFKEPWPAP